MTETAPPAAAPSTGRARIREGTREEWDALARDAPDATFFHTPAWADAAAGMVRGARPRLLIAEGEGGKTALPSVEYPLPLGLRVVESTFAGTYGGALRAGPAPPPLEDLLPRLVGPRVLEARVLLTPGDATRAPRGFVEKADTTHVIPLAGGVDALAAAWSRDQRYSMRRAEREGVKVRREDAVEALPEYLDVYADTRERWGAKAGPAYPPAFFDRLIEAGGDNVELWTARLDGRIVAGTVVLTWKGHGVAWHAACRKEGLRARAVALMDGVIATDLARRDFTTYDLNPSGDFDGVAAYKAGIGARAVPLRRLTWTNRVLARLHAWKKRLLPAAGAGGPS